MKEGVSLITKQDEERSLVLAKPNRQYKPKVRTGCITCKYVSTRVVTAGSGCEADTDVA